MRNALPLLLLCLVAASAIPKYVHELWGKLEDGECLSVRNILYAASVFIFIVLVLILCTASLLSQASKPSLYASF